MTTGALERAKKKIKTPAGRRAVTAVIVLEAVYLVMAMPLLSLIFDEMGMMLRGDSSISTMFADVGEFLPLGLVVGLFQPRVWLGPQCLVSLLIGLAVAAFALWPLTREAEFPNRILDAQPPEAGNNEHGDSRILRKPSELVREGGLKEWPEDEPEKSAGAVYLGAYDGIAYGHRSDEHTLVLAPTRCGKTSRLLVQQIMNLGASGECIFCFDPKGELFGKTSKYLKSLGYKVNRLDFRYPSRGNRWNPMDRVNAAYQVVIDNGLFKIFREAEEAYASEEDPALVPMRKADRDAAELELKKWLAKAEKEVDILVNTIFPREKGEQSGNKFYNDNGEQVLKIAIHHVASSPVCPPEAKTIITVLQTLEVYGTALDLNPWNKQDPTIVVPLYEEVKRLSELHPAATLFKSLDQSKAEYTKSFIGTAKTQLREFAAIEKARMMSGSSDFQMEDLVDQKTVTYAIIPVNASNADKKFAIMYVDQLYNALVDYAAERGGRLPKRMNMVCEEMGQLPPITDLDGRLAIAASAGFRFILILQNYSKLESVYGREAKNSIISNVNYKVLIMSDDPNTSREWSDVCGTYTQAKTTTSESKGGVTLLADRASTSEGLERRTRLSVADLSSWNVEDCGILVRHPGRHMMNIPAPAFYESHVGEVLGLGDEQECNALAEQLSLETVHPENEPIPSWELCLSSQEQIDEVVTSSKLAKRRDQYMKKILNRARQEAGTKEPVKKPQQDDRPRDQHHR